MLLARVPTRRKRGRGEGREREGRGVGTKGITAAAEELASWMKAAGLMPAGASTGKKGERSFFQPVEVFVGVRDTGSRFRSEAPGPAAAIPATVIGNAPS